MKLNSKLPWNPAEYVPPRSHAILEDAVKARLALNASLGTQTLSMSFCIIYIIIHIYTYINPCMSHEVLFKNYLSMSDNVYIFFIYLRLFF